MGRHNGSSVYAPKNTLNIYNASAGSGKTFTLAAHYIAILLNGESARSILAVTFTNKATAEMKERILQNLYQMSINAEDKSIADFVEKVRSFMPKPKANMDTKEIEKIASIQLREILNDYDHFTITTIDAFLQMLLSEVARIAGLSTNYQVELHDNEVIDSAIDYMVSNLSKMDQVTKRGIISLISSRNEEEKNWDIRKELKSLSKQLKAEPYLNNKEALEEYISQQGNELFAMYRKNLKNAPEAEALKRMRVLLNEYNEKMKSCKVGFHQNWLDSFILRIEKSLNGKAKTEEMFNGLNNQMVDYLNNEDKFHTKYSGDIAPNTYRDTIIGMHNLCNECRKYSLNVMFSTKNLGELGLLNSISEQVTKINREANRILLSSTPILLKQILEKGEDTLFVMERAGIRFNHIMIDEFQDTSSIQWDNFLPLLEEITSKGSVLLVGDVKQSIYRWRGGDWNILNDFYQDKLKQFLKDKNNGEAPHLTRNFRSERNIVEFNLSLFKKAAMKLDDMINQIPSEKLSKKKHAIIQAIYDEKFEGNNIEKFCRSTEKTGLVDVKLFPYEKKKNESNDNMLKEMFNEIVRLRNKGIKPNDILILIRKKKHMVDIVNYLNNHKDEAGYSDITLTSPDAYKLKSSLSVTILVSALRYLANTNDKIALTFLARHYQNDICKQPKPWDAFIDSPQSFLPEQFKEKELLAKPLYEMAEDLVHILLYNQEGERTLNDDSYIFCFMDNMLKYVSNNGANLSGFLDYWETNLSESTIPVPAFNKDIRILTIHKAKGLEAHTVMIPMCDWDIEEDNAEDILWCKPQVEPYNALPLIPITPKKQLQESIYNDDYAEEHFYQRVDNLNLLYVAFTRPQKNLFIYSRVKSQAKDLNSIGDLLVNILGNPNDTITVDNGYSFKQLIKIGECYLSPSKTKAEDNNRLKLNRKDFSVKLKRHNYKMEFRQSNSSHEFIDPMDNDEVIERNAFIRQGNLCHQIFSAIRVPEDCANVLEQFQKEGLIDSDQKLREISSILERCWENEQVKSWFSPSWTLFRECNILARMPDGTIKKNRPDRVMKSENETIVVDYKFGKEKPEYELQVREYMSLLQRMGHREVKGFLWYVYRNQIIEVKLPQ